MKSKKEVKSTVTKEDSDSKYKTEKQTEPCTPLKDKLGISQIQNSGVTPWELWVKQWAAPRCSAGALHLMEELQRNMEDA